ncbi:hypothetical protein METBIDRAFT_32651 [Metschnikowia bicuspidata var. bicuspidata NRRL YB-4993]|uniref:Uncharacterized protein n=1 Tax=Metschnikowia bicuspidata var. bicuspidata NRRL YB-4993 TaxID=869754 RepID=A0A1A0H994_9ASCO|nr:hypothetical protein METBIDRAFT_32651 [Metschnikowia bicuspidata var. bicuspidata NRRL YB-4993]OBA20689.1 hypothetical protein METBIDRAFT_32651 [Metschnikowia bicuspidata var. bicuspidata NRRL YB-4993]
MNHAYELVLVLVRPFQTISSLIHDYKYLVTEALTDLRMQSGNLFFPCTVGHPANQAFLATRTISVQQKILAWQSAYHTCAAPHLNQRLSKRTDLEPGHQPESH